VSGVEAGVKKQLKSGFRGKRGKTEPCGTRRDFVATWKHTREESRNSVETLLAILVAGGIVLPVRGRFRCAVIQWLGPRPMPIHENSQIHHRTALARGSGVGGGTGVGAAVAVTGDMASRGGNGRWGAAAVVSSLLGL